MLRHATILAFTASACLLAGCSATMKHTEGGAYMYESGRLESLESHEFAKVWQASLDAVKDLEFTLEETEKDALEATVKAEQANGRNITIHLNRVDDNTTRLQVKAGGALSSDEGVGEVVLRTVRKRIQNPLPADEQGKALAAEETDK